MYGHRYYVYMCAYTYIYSYIYIYVLYVLCTCVCGVPTTWQTHKDLQWHPGNILFMGRLYFSSSYPSSSSLTSCSSQSWTWAKGLSGTSEMVLATQGELQCTMWWILKFLVPKPLLNQISSKIMMFWVQWGSPMLSNFMWMPRLSEEASS